MMNEGLNSKTVKSNQKLYGLNIIKCEKSNLKKLIDYINEPTIIVTFILIILHLIKKSYIESIILGIIFLILITIHIIIFIKNYKITTKKKNILDYKVKVIRDGNLTTINSTELTLNDVMILNKGDKVMADAIIIESSNLLVWEPSLNSEKNIISKSHNFINKNEKFKSNYVYASSYILKGNCTAKVTNIGKNTQIAKIKDTKNTKEIKNKKTKIINLLNLLAIISMIITIIIIKDNILNRIITGLYICIGILPYPLKLFITKLYPYYIDKFIDKNIYYTKINDLKKINKISCLCIDKSNIITEGKLKVSHTKTNINDNELVKHALLASSLNPIDEIENAILEYSENIEINIKEDKQIIKKFPFDKENKISANIYEENNKYHIYVKGGLESIFDICDIGVQEKYTLYNYKDEMINKGFKVIAVGSQKIDEIHENLFDYKINFEGIICVYDEIKPNIAKYINYCQDNDIRVLLFTEDNKQISSYIGRTIGINNSNYVLDNEEIDSNLNNLKNINIFSHIDSKEKIKIIDSLQKSGNVVMMIGNNTNDIFSLIKSNLSVTYIDSTDINKDNSSIINLNNNFCTIVNNIKETKIFNTNIKRIYNQLFITNMIITLLAILLIITKINISYLVGIISLFKLLLLTYIFVKFKQ